MSVRYIVPLAQSTHKDYYDQEILLQPQTSLNANSLNATNNSTVQLDFHVYATPNKKCKIFIIEYDVQNTDAVNSVSITPSCFFQSYIEYRTSGNKLIQTMNNFNLFKNLSLLDYNQMLQILPKHGINPLTWKPNENCVLQPLQKQQFFLYILGDVFSSNDDIYMEWKDYLLVRLFLVNSQESGSGSVSLLNCQLRIRTEEAKNDTHDVNANYLHKYNFLDYLGVVSSTNTISSALTQIRMQNAIGHNVVSDIVLRNGISVTNGQYRNFLSLGRQSQLNYYDRTNSPILGGSTLGGEEARLLIAPRHVAADWYKYNPVYPIIFGKVNIATLFGRMDGALYEDSYNQVGIQSSSDSLSHP
jgi:hypothetical protein